MDWNHKRIVGTSTFLTILFILAFASLAQASTWHCVGGQPTKRIKMGMPYDRHDIAAALQQCKPVGKPLVLASFRKHGVK